MELKDYLEILKRRKWIVIVAVILTTFTALLMSFLQKPVYQAKVTMILPMQTTIGYLVRRYDNVSSSILEGEMQTQILKIQTRLLAEKVSKKLKPRINPKKLARMVDVEILGDAFYAFELTVTDIDSKRAAQIANGYAESLIYLNRNVEKNELKVAIDQVERKIEEYEQEISVLSKEIDEARQQAPLDPEIPFDGTLPDNIPTKTEVYAQWSSLNNSYNRLVERRDELALVDASKETATLEIVETAFPSSVPLKENPIRNGLLGLVAGLILGVSTASFLEYMDDTLKTKEEIEECFKAPVLAKIAIDSRQIKGDGYQIIAKDGSNSLFAEPYRVLRTNIQFIAKNQKLKSLLFVNVLSRQGKPFVMANLAATLGLMGHKVIVVCSNIRNSKLQNFFGLKKKKVGFSHWFVENAKIENIIFNTNIKGVKIIPPGPLSLNPADLIDSYRMDDLIEQLKKRFDFVLLDVSPILEASDAAILAQKVDGVIAIADVGELSRKAAIEAYGVLQKVKAPLLGIAAISKIQKKEFFAGKRLKPG